MTREEAIRKLIIIREKFGLILTDIGETMDMAISALREQEERSKGCEYCADCKSIYEIKSPLHDSYNTDVYISENALLVDIGCHSFGTAAIEFCPMCGRRLEEV